MAETKTSPVASAPLRAGVIALVAGLVLGFVLAGVETATGSDPGVGWTVLVRFLVWGGGLTIVTVGLVRLIVRR